MRLVAGGLIVFALAAHEADASVFPQKYDRQIEKAAALYLPGVPWRLLKAQYWQESRLNPNAVSPVGAVGIAQFMPGTARDVWGQLGVKVVDPRVSDVSIQAGAFYMQKLRQSWSSQRPWQDRYKLALASYNAGLGNILQSQRECNMAVLYDHIISCLPKVTGDRNSKETMTYAPLIWRWWQQMEAGL